LGNLCCDTHAFLQLRLESGLRMVMPRTLTQDLCDLSG
jgi:hypothetical protein